MADEDKTEGEHDAVLDERFPVLVGPDGAFAVVGIVSGDRKGRWLDGTTVLTSPIISPGRIAPGEMVITLNSRYRLGRPADATVH